eukprot:8136595-Pyramimonas_sp.AAC.1
MARRSRRPSCEERTSSPRLNRTSGKPPKGQARPLELSTSHSTKAVLTTKKKTPRSGVAPPWGANALRTPGPWKFPCDAPRRRWRHCDICATN